MNLSQKCQYALRAVYELARRESDEPVSVAEIADAQEIPRRFCELILGELRRGGFVESRRGPRGGYFLARPANRMTAGEIIRFVEGPLSPVPCADGPDPECSLGPYCAFAGMWRRAAEAMAGVYDCTSFEDLIAETPAAGPHVPSYSI